jgi:hypothetical protein
METKIIDLSHYRYLIALPLTGIITAPAIPLGIGPDMYILRKSHFIDGDSSGLNLSLKKSFESFGFGTTKNTILRDSLLLVVPVTEINEEGVKNALIVSDMALAFFNKKYFSARARFLSWDRKEGKAIGAICSNSKWSPILCANYPGGPAIIKPLDYDFWDWFLSSSLRNQLNELGLALYRCIEWERESQFSSHITHRFAFNWVGLESMMPKGECQEHAIVRRYSLIVGAPRGADSRTIINDPKMNKFFEEYKNEYSKKWAKTIEEMYRYRCTILHTGFSDLNTFEINPKKVDWFYHISKTLSTRIIGLAVNALIDKVETMGDFWNDYIIRFLYSDKNQWAIRGVFFDDHLITFDWENNTYPNII